MDEKTEQYYTTHADDASNLYNSAKKSGVSRYFKEAFIAGSAVLDIGAGSGRDMALLLEMGFDAYGIDSSPEMVKSAMDSMACSVPAVKDRIICASILSNKLFFNRKFDGILCSAVLMHIADDFINEAAVCIRNNLNVNGRLLISIPVMRDDLDSKGRTPDGRLFIMRTIDDYTGLFERHGFAKRGEYTEGDSLGRSGVTWGVAVYELKSS